MIASLIEIALLFKGPAINTYYASGVTSMVQSWHNFFFVAFDPGGFISIDKPPLSLWIQALFGLGWGLGARVIIVPQIIAQLLSVLLLYKIVMEVSGKPAGLLSALFLALMPINVVLAVTNQPDSILIFFLLCSVRLYQLWLKSSQAKYLLLSAILIGVSFNTKGLIAFTILPGFLLVYLLCTINTVWKKLVSTIILLFIIFATSLSWASIVDLVPKNHRPFIGSTQTNSALSLVFGYNGYQRIFGRTPVANSTDIINKSADQELTDLPAFGGKPGFFRLWNAPLSGQASWLIVPALFGFFAVLVKPKKQKNIPEYFLNIFWITSLIMSGVAISFAKFMHPYYVSIMAPALAALGGIGIILLGNYFSSNSWRKWLLPVMLILSTFSYWQIINHFPEYYWLKLATTLLFTISALYLILILWLSPNARKNVIATVSLVYILALLALPVTWIMRSWTDGIDPVITQAGPNKSKTAISQRSIKFDKSLLNFLKTNRNGSKYIVATEGSRIAEDIIIQTQLPVMNLGGFNNTDLVLTTEKLTQKIQAGEIRYFLIGDEWDETNPNYTKKLWIKNQCQLIKTTGQNNIYLYDCQKGNKNE